MQHSLNLGMKAGNRKKVGKNSILYNSEKILKFRKISTDTSTIK